MRFVRACLSAILLAVTGPAAHAVNENVTAQLSWDVADTLTDVTVDEVTTTRTLYVRLAGVESFKGAEIDLRWDPPGTDDPACAALTDAAFPGATGTSCTYLNRGNTVPLTLANDAGSYHAAWANTATLETCASGSIVAVTFDFAGCAATPRTWTLCRAAVLDSSNEFVAIADTGHPATVNGGSPMLPTCNVAPQLNAVADQIVISGETLEFSFSASDADHDALTLAARPLPDGATAAQAGSTLTVTWTPRDDNSQVGTYALTAEAFDGHDSTTAPFTIDVLHANHAPVITAVADQSIGEGEELVVPIATADPDGDTVTLLLSDGLPVGASIVSSTFHWTPSLRAAQANGGVTRVVLEAMDPDGAAATDTFLVHVADASPPIVAAIDDQVVKEGSLLIVTPTLGGNTDGDPLQASGLSLPPGAHVDATTGQFSWAPTFAQAGAYPAVSLCASDGAATSCASFAIAVTDVNRDPVIESVADQFVAVGSPLAVTPVAADPDGDPLAWLGEGLPAGALLDQDTGAVTWTPGAGDEGLYPSVMLIAEDGRGGAAAVSFTITVQANAPPVIASIAHQSVAERALLTVTPSASDPENDPLAWEGIDLPAGATVDAGTGVFTWTPPCGSAGAYPGVTLRVTDVFGGAASEAFTITVTASCTPVTAINATASRGVERWSADGLFPVRLEVLGEVAAAAVTPGGLSLERNGLTARALDVRAAVDGAGAYEVLFPERAVYDLVHDLAAGAHARLGLMLDTGGVVASTLVDVFVADAGPANVTVSPRPARGSARVRIVVPRDVPVHIALYAPDGRRVCTLREGSLAAGVYTEQWNGLSETGRAVEGIFYVRGAIGDVPVSSRLVFLH